MNYNSKKNKVFTLTIITLIVLLIICSVINISVGSVSIPFYDTLSILTGKTPSKASWQTIILNYRLPKTITAILVGSGLSVCGLLMQTLFKNPLAGPFVLGISSGSSLGVALLILACPILGIPQLTHHGISLTIASSTGALIVLSLIIYFANKIRNTMAILIIGLMFSTIAASIINVLTYFSSATQLQQFLFWNLGNLGNLKWTDIYTFIGIYIICFSALFSIVKPLNSLTIGELYAKSLGTNIIKTKNIILLITSLLTGCITAFTGPITFIGLATPHITKLCLKTSNHKILLPTSSILGAILLLCCDSIAQLPNFQYSLPINAITSLLGAPLVIGLIIKRYKNLL